MTEKKMQGAIKAIFLDDNTFHGVTINPTLINYFTVKWQRKIHDCPPYSF